MLQPKVANTAIKVAILEALGQPTDVPHHPRRLIYVDKARARGFRHRVAFVRDPLARVASCYRDKIAGNGEFLRGFEALGLTRDMTFLQFVERVALIPDARATNAGQHFRSQSYSLCDGDEIIPSFVGRFERLADDWLKVQALVMANGGPRLPELKPANRSTAPAPVYCARARSFALQRYRDDVRLFGYQPERKWPIDPDAVTRGRSICNVHREIYRLARDRIGDPSLSQRIMDLTAEAFDQGKRMNAKLRGRGEADG